MENDNDRQHRAILHVNVRNGSRSVRRMMDEQDRELGGASIVAVAVWDSGGN